MKILIINNNFDLKTGGGAERYVLDVVEGLKKRGHKVFISTNTEYLDKVAVVYVNNCFNTSLLKELTNKPAIRFIHDHQLYCPGTPKYWFNSQKQCRINTSPKCLYYSFAEQCLSRNPIKAVPAVLGKKRELEVNRRFGKLLVASSFMREMLITNGFESGKIEVNHLFPYSKKGVSNLQVGGSPPLILYVGRIFKEKGVYQLIQAAALIKQDFRLLVCGTGWDRERCDNITKELNLGNKVRFPGFVPRDELLSLYGEAELVVVPSVWPEPFGLVGIEAFQHSKPVVAFDSGGISEWLKDGKNGLLIERLNIKQLAQGIEKLLTDKKLASRMGKFGKTVVEKDFSLEKHLDKLEKVFEQVLR